MNNLSLKDHIDEPILKCVVGLNLLGIKTGMSCCGFDYENPKVPKSHLKPYIYIIKESLNNPQKCQDLLEIMHKSCWSLNGNVGPIFFDLMCDSWDERHPWSKRDSIHNYEVPIIKIQFLENSINEKVVSKDFNEDYSVLIEDGNKLYLKQFRKWVYKPALDWKVTYAEYKNL